MSEVIKIGVEYGVNVILHKMVHDHHRLGAPGAADDVTIAAGSKKRK